MKMRFGLAAAAALALAACGQGGMLGGGPPLPQTPEGAQAPTELTGTRADSQANLTDEQRAELVALVRSYIDEVQANFGEGMAPAEGFPEMIVPMQPSTDQRYQVDLVGGTPYRFIGACDNECSNVDIELIAPQGGVVASDLLADDYPVANFTPPENGRYLLRLIMQTCTIAPCYAGVRVMSAAPAGAAAADK